MTKHCGEKMEDGRCVVCDYVEKLCPTCGKVIPTNGVSEERDEKGNYFYRKAPRLICETCAINACPPMPRLPRRKRGEVDAAQESFNVPTIEI